MEDPTFTGFTGFWTGDGTYLIGRVGDLPPPFLAPRFSFYKLSESYYYFLPWSIGRDMVDEGVTVKTVERATHPVPSVTYL